MIVKFNLLHLLWIIPLVWCLFIGFLMIAFSRGLRR